MTITPPPPYQPEQNGQPVHGAPPAQYPAQQWQTRVPRPPLTRRAKSGSLWAGIVGFNLLSLGWVLFIIPVVLGLFAAFFTFILDQLGRSSSGRSNGYYQLRDFVETVHVSAWVVPLLVLSLVGLAIWALGIFVSGRILKSHAVNHPWGVTWAAAGIAIVADWFLSWIGGIVAQVFSVAMGASDAPVWAAIAVTGGVGIVVAIVVNSVIGWLAWWWMAHAMRGAQPASVPVL